MRLIDADTYLAKVCTYKETGCGSCKFSTVCPVDAPTVKAIPVEWLKEKYSWLTMAGEIIKDWEKENE